MKRTFQPSSKLKRNRKIGFRKKMSTNSGKRILSNRRRKMRKILINY